MAPTFGVFFLFGQTWGIMNLFTERVSAEVWAINNCGGRQWKVEDRNPDLIRKNLSDSIDDIAVSLI